MNATQRRRPRPVRYGSLADGFRPDVRHLDHTMEHAAMLSEPDPLVARHAYADAMEGEGLRAHAALIGADDSGEFFRNAPGVPGPGSADFPVPARGSTFHFRPLRDFPGHHYITLRMANHARSESPPGSPHAFRWSVQLPTAQAESLARALHAEGSTPAPGAAERLGLPRPPATHGRPERLSRRPRPVRYAGESDDDAAGTPTVARAPSVPAADALKRVGAGRKWLNAAARVKKDTARPPLDPALFKLLDHVHKTAGKDKRLKTLAAAAILGLSPTGAMGLADHVRQDFEVPPSNYDPTVPGGRVPVRANDAYAQLGRMLASRNHPLARALNWDRVGRGVVLDHAVEDWMARRGHDPKIAHWAALNKGNTKASGEYRKANPGFYESLPGAEHNAKQQKFLKQFTAWAGPHVPGVTVDDVGRAFVRAAMRAHTPHGPNTGGMKPAEARKADLVPMSERHLRRYRRVPLASPDA